MAKKRKIVYLAPTRIYVKDFGPVREADMELGKLTILMGPNNTGKTYTTLLILLLDEFLKLLPLFTPFMKLREAVLKEFFKLPLSGIFTKLYSVKEPKELIRRGADKALIRFLLKETESLSSNVYAVEFLIDKSGTILPKLHGLEALSNRNVIFQPHRIIYVPAERAGIMRTYKQLLRLHLETSWFDIPPRLRKRVAKMVGDKVHLPGVVGVLLDHILSIEKFTLDERMKAYIGPALDILEEEVLRGRIEMSEDLSVMYYEREVERPIDLINASSMVSEISAIYILAGMLSKYDWMIIEEPESHVHPRGQMGLARFMAMLARNGVNVVATTHSDLIALKLAQMVGLAGLRPEQRVLLGYKENEYLEKQDLALYFMEQTESGSVSRRIDVSDTGELSDLPTYSRVIEEMYGEAVKLLEFHGKIPKLSEKG